MPLQQFSQNFVLKFFAPKQFGNLPMHPDFNATYFPCSSDPQQVSHATERTMRAKPDTILFKSCNFLKLNPHKRILVLLPFWFWCAKAMEVLEFFEDLWSPLSDGSPPSTEIVSQTSGGVAIAVWNFAKRFFESEEDARAISRSLQSRSALSIDETITFKNEFLHLAAETVQGLIVVVIGKCGYVKSVDACKSGEAPRALTRQGARALFSSGRMAVVVDFEGAMSVSVHAWSLQSVQLAARVSRGEVPDPPNVNSVVASEQGGTAPFKRVVSESSVEMNRLLGQAALALNHENWGLRRYLAEPPSSCPSTEAE